MLLYILKSNTCYCRLTTKTLRKIYIIQNSIIRIFAPSCLCGDDVPPSSYSKRRITKLN